jgi:hypothetical protein
MQFQLRPTESDFLRSSVSIRPVLPTKSTRFPLAPRLPNNSFRLPLIADPAHGIDFKDPLLSGLVLNSLPTLGKDDRRGIERDLELVDGIRHDGFPVEKRVEQRRDVWADALKGDSAPVIPSESEE